MAHEVAAALVESGAYVNKWDNREQWVALPDGHEVPVYLSCRRLISQPETKRILKQKLSEVVEEEFAEAEMVAGLATAGIVWGDAASEALDKPFVYIRGSKKGYGIGGLVEGEPVAGADTLLVDDTLFSGESLILARDALEEENGSAVVGALTIASLHPGGAEAFERTLGAKSRALTDYEEILDVADDVGMLTEDQVAAMREYYRTGAKFDFDSV